MNAASRPETEARAEVHYTLQQGAKTFGFKTTLGCIKIYGKCLLVYFVCGLSK